MDHRVDKASLWQRIAATLIIIPFWFIHGIIFDLSIWYRNADWLHPLRTWKSRHWQTLWEGRLEAVEELIAHETDEDSPAYGQAYLALRLIFTRGIRIMIDRYGPPTASAPRELRPGRRIAVRRNGLGEYRFDSST